MSTQKHDRKQRKQVIVSPLAWIGITFVLIIALSTLPFLDYAPLGEKVDILSDTSHVPEGSDPGPYNSDPPTSGRHYEEHFTSRFFETNSYAYPEGFLVHNLEHGYIIFWYNCDILTTQECAALKSDIKSVMEGVDMYKVIAFPWTSIRQPVVMTSWGRILRFEQFDPKVAATFIEKYQNHAPEPQGD